MWKDRSLGERLGFIFPPQGYLKEPQVPVCLSVPAASAPRVRWPGLWPQPLPQLSPVWKAKWQSHQVYCVLGCCRDGTWHLVDASKILR